MFSNIVIHTLQYHEPFTESFSLPEPTMHHNEIRCPQGILHVMPWTPAKMSMHQCISISLHMRDR